MPIYEYRCKKGHSFEVMQRMVDDTLTACTVCGAPVQRVFHPVAVHFKGKGFYTTDYGKGGGAASASSDGKSDSTSDNSDSKKSDSDSSKKDAGSKKSETKSASKE